MNATKRWVAVAVLHDSGTYRVRPVSCVWEPGALVESLLALADGGTALLGVDFPVGLPQAWADSADACFPDLVREWSDEQLSVFVEPGVLAADVTLQSPFYPRVSKGTTRRTLVERLELAHERDLWRVCERAEEGRRLAAPVFWLVGANQVGRAAAHGWRELLRPAVADHDARMWPFDGQLGELLEEPGLVIAETYPGGYSNRLSLKVAKKDGSSRRAAAIEVAEQFDGLHAQLDPVFARELESGFGSGPEGEDPFDAVVGLLAMLLVVRGSEGWSSVAPAACLHTEGWILGC